MRYNPVERIGINATEQIFIKEFEWIFREQPIVDVGIDALVEEAEAGNPTGKFIALQVKSGKGNFLISERKLTYYISNIHYNYWLEFGIPVILVAHIPEWNKTYWIEISEQNIKKATKRWKIEIPYKNQLNSRAKVAISRLLTKNDREYKSLNIFKGEDIDEQTIFDIEEKLDCITDSKDSTIKTIDLLEELTLKINESNEKFKYYNQKGLSIQSPEVKASVNTYAKNINIYSTRLENECQIFSATFAVGFIAYQRAFKAYSLIAKNNVNMESSIKSLEKILVAIENAIGGVQVFKNSLLAIPNNLITLKEAKKSMLSVVSLMIEEYIIAKSIVTGLIKSASDFK